MIDEGRPGGLAFWFWVILEMTLPASLICDMMDFTNLRFKIVLLLFPIVTIWFSLIGGLKLKIECFLLFFGEQFEVIIIESERVTVFDFLSIFQCDCFGIGVTVLVLVVLIFTPWGLWLWCL